MESATVLGGLPVSWFTNGGAVALLALVFWSVIRGYLVPARTVDKVEADRDHWRKAAEKQADTLAALADQNKDLLEGMRVVTTVVQEIQRTGRKS